MNKDKLQRFNNQARIQAETYNSKYYAEKVLKVYNRAIKEKKEENRFGLFSTISKKIREIKNDYSTKQ